MCLVLRSEIRPRYTRFGYYGQYLNNKISCFALCVSQNIVASCFVRRTLNARHDILRDTQCDTQYFARQAKRRTIFCAIHEAKSDIYHDISPFGLPTQGPPQETRYLVSSVIPFEKHCVFLHELTKGT